MNYGSADNVDNLQIDEVPSAHNGDIQIANQFNFKDDREEQHTN